MTEQHPPIFFSYRRTNLLLVDHLHQTPTWLSKCINNLFAIFIANCSREGL